MPIDARIAMADTGPKIDTMSNAMIRANTAKQGQMRNAMTQTSMDEYEQQAPARQLEQQAGMSANQASIDANDKASRYEQMNEAYNIMKTIRPGDESSLENAKAKVRAAAKRRGASPEEVEAADDNMVETLASLGDVNQQAEFYANKGSEIEQMMSEFQGSGAVTEREKLDQRKLEETGRGDRFSGLRGSQDLTYIGDAVTAKDEAGRAVEEAGFEGDVTQAELEAEAKARGGIMGRDMGEAESKLMSLDAAMPQLYNMGLRLKELSQTATFTKAGQFADAVARQAGQSTKGGIARNEFQLVVDNEVLPLLRQTFGAAFTAAEGDKLNATLGDVNLHPDEKIAALNAFFKAKENEVLTLMRKTGRTREDLLTDATAWEEISGQTEGAGDGANKTNDILSRYGL